MKSGLREYLKKASQEAFYFKNGKYVVLWKRMRIYEFIF